MLAPVNKAGRPNNTHIIRNILDFKLSLAGRQWWTLLELRGSEQAVNDAKPENVVSLRLPSDNNGVGLLVSFLHNDVLHQGLGSDGVVVVNDGVLGGSDDEVIGPAGELTVSRLSLQRARNCARVSPADHTGAPAQSSPHCLHLGGRRLALSNLPNLQPQLGDDVSRLADRAGDRRRFTQLRSNVVVGRS